MKPSVTSYGKRRGLRIALFYDREDWILGTVANQIREVLGGTSGFEFHLALHDAFLRSPFAQLRAFMTCDIIHWLVPFGCLDLGPLFPNKPHICTINHCTESDCNYPEYYSNVRVLTMSKVSRRQLQARGFDRVGLVHYGVDPEVFHSLPRAYCREKLAIQTDRLLVGFCAKESSNPGDRKGTRILAATLELVNAKKSVALLLSGDGWVSLKQGLEAKGIEVHQRQVPSLADMPILYGALDLYLCTSRVEGGPVPVLEAMACGRPVVSTPVGHVPEVISHEENGLLIPLDDPEAAANAVLQVLTDEAFARRIAEKGRATVLERWSWERVLEPLPEIYKHVALSNHMRTFSILDVSRAYAMLMARFLRHGVIGRKQRAADEDRCCG